MCRTTVIAADAAAVVVAPIPFQTHELIKTHAMRFRCLTQLPEAEFPDDVADKDSEFEDEAMDWFQQRCFTCIYFYTVGKKKAGSWIKGNFSYTRI